MPLIINNNPGLFFALSLIILFLVSRLTTLYRQKLKARQLQCLSLPTEPTRFLGLDTLLQTIRASRDHRLPEYFISRITAMKAYTFRASFLGASHIVTADPKNIQAVLATQFVDFKLTEARRLSFRLCFGRSIFTAEGEEWHAAREIIRPIFTRVNVFHLALLERHLQVMWSCIREGEVVSLNALFHYLTIDSATELFLGKSSDSLKERAAERRGEEKDFHWAFDKVQHVLATRLRESADDLADYWVSTGLYNPKELKESTRILNDFTSKAIQEADEKKGDTRYDYLSVIRSRTSDVSEVREHVLGLLIAGRDTTASLLGWTFYCLVRDQRVLGKLRKIVLETFGTEASMDASFEKLKGCRYLQFVLNETLRIHSILPMNSRAAKHDTTLPSGGGPDGTAPIFVPKDTEIRLSTHAMHRRHDIWGPDADEFVPERWETARPGWAYTPFNGGPRLCIGQQFALTEAGYVIVRMLQRFDQVENMDIDIDPTREYHNYGVTCGPGPGHDSVKVRLRLAQRASS